MLRAPAHVVQGVQHGRDGLAIAARGAGFERFRGFGKSIKAKRAAGAFQPLGANSGQKGNLTQCNTCFGIEFNHPSMFARRSSASQSRSTLSAE